MISDKQYVHKSKKLMQRLSLEMKDPEIELKFKKIQIGYDIVGIEILTGIIVVYFLVNSFLCVVIFE